MSAARAANPTPTLITHPPTPRPQVIVNGLERCIRPGASDGFTLAAHNLEADGDHDMELTLITVDSGSLGFDAACTTTSTTYDASATHVPTIHSCGTGAAAGIVSAVLSQSEGEGEDATKTEVDRTNDYLVFVIPEDDGTRSAARAPAKPSASASPNVPSDLDDGENTGRFWATISGLDSTHSGTMTFKTSNSNAGFTSSCSLRSASRLWPASDTSRTFGPFILYGCGSGQVTASIQVTQTSPGGDTFNHGTVKSWTINRAPIIIPPTQVPSKPRVSVAASTTGPITEGGDAEFTLTSNKTFNGNVNVGISDSPRGVYYAGPPTVQVSMSGTSAGFSVTTTEDTTYEPDGSVSAQVESGTGYTAATGTAVVVVEDDDEPLVSITRHPSTPARVVESSTVSFVLTADPRPAVDTDVMLRITGGDTFLSGAPVTSKTIEGGEASAVLTLRTAHDTDDERDDDITVTVVGGSGYGVGSPDSATVTVEDDDVPPKPAKLRINGHLVGGTDVTLRWSPVADAGRYQIQYVEATCDNARCTPKKVGLAVAWRTALDVTTRTVRVRGASTVEASVGDLMEGRLYQIQVRAVIVDQSDPSDPVAVWPTYAPPSETSPPPTSGIETGVGGPKIAGTRIRWYRAGGMFNYKVCNPSSAPTMDHHPHQIPTDEFTVAEIVAAIGQWDDAVVWVKPNGQNIVQTSGGTKTVCQDPMGAPPTENEVAFYAQEMVSEICGVEGSPGCWSHHGGSLDDTAAPPGLVKLTIDRDWDAITPGRCKALDPTTTHEAGHALGLWDGTMRDSIQAQISLPRNPNLCGPTIYDAAVMRANYQSR